MLGSPIVVAIATEVSLALSLPVAFVLAYPTCAPISLGCLAYGVGCVLVCGAAWPQFPAVLEVGALLALIPAILSWVVTRAHLRRHHEPDPGPPLDTVFHSILFTLLGVVLFIASFPLMGAQMIVILSVLPLAVSMAIVLSWLGVRRVLRGWTATSS